MSVSLGTLQLSYTVTAPVDSGSPVSVAVTNAIYDKPNTLVESDGPDEQQHAVDFRAIVIVAQ